MKDRELWVLWRFGHPRDGGKRPKQPIDPRTGRPTNARAEAAGLSFDRARRWYDDGAGDGLGFIIGGEFAGVDLDNSVGPDGQLDPWAEETLAAAKLRGTYCELSPSRQGLHGIAFARHPAGLKPSFRVDLPVERDEFRGPARIELYYGESRQFFTVTGNRLPDTGADVTRLDDPLQDLHRQLHERYAAKPKPTIALAVRGGAAALPDEEVIRLARTNGKVGAKVERLLRGDWSGYASPSHAFQALAQYLAFWSGNVEQLAALLAHTCGGFYGKARIRADIPARAARKALESCQRFYAPGQGRGAALPPSTPIGQAPPLCKSLKSVPPPIRARERQQSEPLPAEFAQLPANLQPLAHYCRCLQVEVGDVPFGLGVDQAHVLVGGCSPRTMARNLNRLERLGVLELVTKGVHKGPVSEWRYVGRRAMAAVEVAAGSEIGLAA
jgi:hypothetical protein